MDGMHRYIRPTPDLLCLHSQWSSRHSFRLHIPFSCTALPIYFVLKPHNDVSLFAANQTLHIHGTYTYVHQPQRSSWKRRIPSTSLFIHDVQWIEWTTEAVSQFVSPKTAYVFRMIERSFEWLRALQPLKPIRNGQIVTCGDTCGASCVLWCITDHQMIFLNCFFLPTPNDSLKLSLPNGPCVYAFASCQIIVVLDEWKKKKKRFFFSTMQTKKERVLKLYRKNHTNFVYEKWSLMCLTLHSIACAMCVRSLRSFSNEIFHVRSLLTSSRLTDALCDTFLMWSALRVCVLNSQHRQETVSRKFAS